ncbi:MAG: hypothetical protein PUP92_07970 [Rhizonema sp. PD38]|nr:hypothetical protein [Rhizonema sp. PD38]
MPPTHLTSATTIIAHSDSDQANKFTFTKLVDTANDFTTFGSIAFNNQGVVAFSAAKNASGITGIYTTDGQTITTIADIDTVPSLFTDIKPESGASSVTVSNFLFDSNNIAINNAGTVVFSVTANIKQEPGTSGYYTNAYERLFQSQGNTIQLVDARTDFKGGNSFETTNRYTTVGINDSGQIVYSEVKTDSTPRINTITNIALIGRFSDSGDKPPEGPPSAVSSPIINNQGTLFYNRYGYFNNSTTFTNSIFRLGSEDSIPVAVLDQVQGGVPLASNDLGDLVFSGYLTSTESGLFLIHDGVITKVNNALAGNAKINNLGKIAFQPSQSGSGIFITSGADILKVIAPGDILSGSTVANVKFGGLNDVGEIAFVASLTDGTTQIFRADPIRKHHLKHPTSKLQESA